MFPFNWIPKFFPTATFLLVNACFPNLIKGLRNDKTAKYASDINMQKNLIYMHKAHLSWHHNHEQISIKQIRQIQNDKDVLMAMRGNMGRNLIQFTEMHIFNLWNLCFCGP